MKILPLRSLFALVLTLISLCGCVVAPTARDGERLEPRQGLLAFHVTSNADAYLNYIDYSSTSTFGSRFGEEMVGPKGQFRIKAGETFYVVPMDAGEYMFSKFMVDSKFTWLQATNRFKVSANTITYIGHIRINVTNQHFAIQASDREFDMRTYLADTYPVYFKAMSLEKSFAELRMR